MQLRGPDCAGTRVPSCRPPSPGSSTYQGDYGVGSGRSRRASGLAARVALAVWPVMTEKLRHAGRRVPGFLPDLPAAGHTAGHLDMPVAGSLSSGAVTRFPADGDRARPPGMVAPALLRETWPLLTSFLCHADIQTHYRYALEATITVAGAGACCSDRDQVAHENQGLAWCDRVTSSPVSVGQTRWNDQLAAAADLHSLHPLVPAGDDLPDAEPELERSVSGPASVELLARRVRNPNIVDLYHVACPRYGATTFPDIRDLQFGRRLAAGEVDLRLIDAHIRVSLSSSVTATGSRPAKHP